MGKLGYYAVANGRQTGIFLTWSECEASVKGFPGAIHKKFPVREEAEAFLAGNGHKSQGQSITSGSNTGSGEKRKRSSEVPSVNDWTMPPSTMPQQQNPAPHSRIPMRPHNVATTTAIPGSSSYPQCPARTPVMRAAGAGQSGPQVAHALTTQGMPIHTATANRTAPRPSAPSCNEGSVFYAIAKGRRTGVFTSWSEAEPLVRDMHSAKFKRFSTRAEAEQFVDEFKTLKAPLATDPNPEDPSTLVAFCDGSAIGNGKPGSKAGWACIFPHNTQWNVGEPLRGWNQTNNRAEYSAAIAAIRRANIEDPVCSKPLYIFTDSMLLVRSMTEWFQGWKDRGWIKADGERVQNVDLLIQLDAERGRRRVIWHHVKAHTGGKDWRSRWNDVADEEAKKQAMKPPPKETKKKSRSS